jgi:hypothetical protein
MSVLNLIKVGAAAFAIGAAIGGGVSAAIVVHRSSKAAKATLDTSKEFDAEIETNLRKAGGEELVMQYRMEVARRTGKI